MNQLWSQNRGVAAPFVSWWARGKVYSRNQRKTNSIYHLSSKNHLKRVSADYPHTLSLLWVGQSTYRRYKNECDMRHMIRTVMRLTHVQWTSSSESYRKPGGLKCCLMMDRSNIEWAISKGGEHKAMSSLAHLSSYPPSLFTPSHNQNGGGGGGYSNSHTAGHTNTHTKTHETTGNTHKRAAFGHRALSSNCSRLETCNENTHMHMHNIIFTKRNYSLVGLKGSDVSTWESSGFEIMLSSLYWLQQILYILTKNINLILWNKYRDVLQKHYSNTTNVYNRAKKQSWKFSDSHQKQHAQLFSSAFQSELGSSSDAVCLTWEGPILNRLLWPIPLLFS